MKLIPIIISNETDNMTKRAACLASMTGQSMSEINAVIYELGLKELEVMRSTSIELLCQKYKDVE